jgi:hypothetical protein
MSAFRNLNDKVPKHQCGIVPDGDIDAEWIGVHEHGAPAAGALCL